MTSSFLTSSSQTSSSDHLMAGGAASPHIATAEGIVARKRQRTENLQQRALLLNRQIIFDALKAAGIDQIDITFDGTSDNGQIEAIEAAAGTMPLALPQTPIALWRCESGELRPNPEPFEGALETFAYDLLWEHEAGWENGDGAFGTIILMVQAETITIACHQRFIETTLTTSHV